MSRSITPDSYEANTVALAVSMLAACAAWQTAVDVEDATGAKASIVESWGGDPRQNLNDGQMINALGEPVALAGPLAIVDLRSLQPSLAGIGEWDRTGEVRIYIEAPFAADELPPDVMARMRTLMGTLRSQIESQIGTPTGFAVAQVASEGPWIPELSESADVAAQTPARRGEFEFTVTFYG